MINLGAVKAGKSLEVVLGADLQLDVVDIPDAPARGRLPRRDEPPDEGDHLEARHPVDCAAAHPAEQAVRPGH